MSYVWSYDITTGYPKNDAPTLPTYTRQIPCAYALWRNVDNVIKTLLQPELPQYTMSAPYPFYVWKIEEEPRPTISAFYTKKKFGACANSLDVETVIIPNSVSYIGREAFYYTKISSVILPTNCTYYSTSFPIDCEITGGILIE